MDGDDGRPSESMAESVGSAAAPRKEASIEAKDEPAASLEAELGERTPVTPSSARCGRKAVRTKVATPA